MTHGQNRAAGGNSGGSDDARSESRQILADRIRHQHLHVTGKKGNALKVVAVILALLGCAALLWIQLPSTQRGEEEIPVPANSTENFGFLFTPDDMASDGSEAGASEAPVPVVLYEDFLCASCKVFHEQSSDMLLSQVVAGLISIEYRPLSFLSQLSTDEYSLRAANAAVCVASIAGVSAFVAMHQLLFEHQPALGESGLSDEQLIALASTSGANGAANCITDRTYEAWITRALEVAVAANVSSTPSVRVAGVSITKMANGKEFAPGPEELQFAIEQAKK